MRMPACARAHRRRPTTHPALQSAWCALGVHRKATVWPLMAAPYGRGWPVYTSASCMIRGTRPGVRLALTLAWVLVITSRKLICNGGVLLCGLDCLKWKQPGRRPRSASWPWCTPLQACGLASCLGCELFASGFAPGRLACSLLCACHLFWRDADRPASPYIHQASANNQRMNQRTHFPNQCSEKI